MTLEQFARTCRYVAPPLAVAALCLSLAACGGGGDEQYMETADAPDQRTSAVAATNTLEVGITLPGHPHKVDVYRPANAKRAIVFLHGQGGRSGLLAYDLGFNKVPSAVSSRTVNWDWLARNGIIAVIPQGQVKAGGSYSAWSNYVSSSGQDDVAFLEALAAHVRTAYGAADVSLAGHSAGGAMAARMWCESAGSYSAYVALAGPMPASSYPTPGPTCTPLVRAPYYAVIGGRDSKLPLFMLGGQAPTPEQAAAGLTQSYLVSEWTRHQGRSLADCSEVPALDKRMANANAISWSACGQLLRYTVVPQADHPIASIEQNLGVKAADLVAGFVGTQLAKPAN